MESNPEQYKEGLMVSGLFQGEASKRDDSKKGSAGFLVLGGGGVLD